MSIEPKLKWNSPEYKRHWYLKQKEKRILWREQDLCIDCGKPTIQHTRCPSCKLAETLRNKQRTQRLSDAGLCLGCGKNPSIVGYACCGKCKEKARENYKINSEKIKAKVSSYNYDIKRIVFNHYGNKCIQCTENRLPCLELDHINNDGADHRESLGLHRHNGGGTKFYRKLINTGFPEDLQILCANCHALKHAERWDPNAI